MINQRKTEIKVGIVTIVALVLFSFGMTLVRGCNVAVSQQYINIRFPNSGGIQLSNPVVVNGVKRGKVTSIKNDAGSVLVEVSIDNIDDIYTDASAMITILEITGGKKIEINPGISEKKFNPETEMHGEISADIASLFILVGDMSNALVDIVRRLDTLTEKFSFIINTEGFTDNVSNIVKNTDELIANANSLLKQNLSNINNIIADIRSLVSNMNNDYHRYEPRLDTLVNNLNIAVNSANKTMTRIDTSINSANNILTDVNSITSEIKNGQGTISKLIYDKQFAAQLDSTVANLNELIDLIRQFGVNVNVRLGTRP
jgi:phospholipid/cholesterol/gamma-HCH transport system substrate-binding protein